MEQQPIRPLDYATRPTRTRAWLPILLILGAAATAFLLFVLMSFSVRRTPRAAVTATPIIQTTSYPPFLANFDDSEVGSGPTPFSSALTGDGGPVTWVIVQDGNKKVLAQTSTDSTNKRFPLCVYKSFTAKDAEVSTRFKAISGKVDQAGGLVVRYQDKDNYYVVRANALENNVRLYRVIDGKRTQFAGADVKVTSGEWHQLMLAVKGSHFKVSYEGKPLFEADDSSIGTAGQVGFWTKADSVTEFEMLIYNAIGR